MRRLPTIKFITEKVTQTRMMEELEWCAILQGFGLDLKPLYQYPVINSILWLKLYDIYKEEKKKEVQK